MSNTKAPELNMPAGIYSYIRSVIKKAGSSEVGGLGIIVYDDDGIATIIHHRLLKQKVSPSSVDWDPEAHTEYLEWLYTPEEDGGAGFTENNYGLYSWHSHGNMSAYFSATDDGFINDVGQTAPYIFSSVFNQRNDVKHRLDIWVNLNEQFNIIDDNRTHITFKDCALNIIENEDARPIISEIEIAEIEFEAQVALLKADRDSVIDNAKKRLTELQKDSLAEIDGLVEDDFKKYVDLGKSTTMTTTTKTTSTVVSSGASDGEGDSPKDPSDTNQGADQKKIKDGEEEKTQENQAKESDDTDQDDDDELSFNKLIKEVMKIKFNGFDTITEQWDDYSVSQYLQNEGLVPKDEFPMEIYHILDGWDSSTLAVRPTYKEYVETLESQDWGAHRRHS